MLSHDVLLQAPNPTPKRKFTHSSSLDQYQCLKKHKLPAQNGLHAFLPARQNALNPDSSSLYPTLSTLPLAPLKSSHHFSAAPAAPSIQNSKLNLVSGETFPISTQENILKNHIHYHQRPVALPTSRANPLSKPQTPLKTPINVNSVAYITSLARLICVITNDIFNDRFRCSKPQLYSLYTFILETFKYSRLSVSILEVAAIYLIRAKSSLAKRKSAQANLGVDKLHLLALIATANKGNCDDLLMRSVQSRLISNLMSIVNSNLPNPALNSTGNANVFCSNTPITRNLTQSSADSDSLLVPQSYNSISSTSSTPDYSPVTPIDIQSTEKFSFIPNDNKLKPVTTNPSPVNIEAVPKEFAQTISNIIKLYNAYECPTQDNVFDEKNFIQSSRNIIIASLMSASKFMLDKSYSNKAWNKITNINTKLLNRIEIGFLTLVNYHLHVSHAEFMHFRDFLS